MVYDNALAQEYENAINSLERINMELIDSLYQ